MLRESYTIYVNPVRKHKGKLIFLGFVVLGIFLFLWGQNGSTEPNYESATVRNVTLTREVSVTGRVEPSSRISLAFEVGGRVKAINTLEGGWVTKGQSIALLDGAVLNAKRREAVAALAREQAVLDEILAGTRIEEVQVSESSVEKTNVELVRAEKSLEGVVERAYILASDEVREQVDQFFENPTTEPTFEVNIKTGNTTYKIRADKDDEAILNAMRSAVTDRLRQWKSMIDAPGTMDVLAQGTAAQNHLEYIQTFLTELSEVIHDLKPSDTTQQTVYDNFKSDVSTARSAISSLITELRVEVEALDVQYAALTISEDQLTSTKAPARTESINVQEAAIKSAEASIAQIDAQLTQLSLLAPSSGTVTSVDVEPGEVVAAGTSVFEMIGDGVFEISAFIPEADIADVQVGNTAKVTLDAFGKSRVFEARVVDVAPAETILDGVPTYETTMEFSGDATGVKSGMTAEVDLLTREINDVLFIPQRSVEREDGRVFVRVVAAGGELVERDIITGLRGSNGMIEVQTGLSEGEEIVLFLDE